MQEIEDEKSCMRLEASPASDKATKVRVTTRGGARTSEDQDKEPTGAGLTEKETVGGTEPLAEHNPSPKRKQVKFLQNLDDLQVVSDDDDDVVNIA